MARNERSVEGEIELLRLQLRVMGFAVAKEIARLRGLESGVMECPLCQQDLRFSVAPSNGHMVAKCETENCLDARE